MAVTHSKGRRQSHTAPQVDTVVTYLPTHSHCVEVACLALLPTV